MRSTARIALHAFGALFAVLAVLLGLGAWRLSSGPLSLGFLSPYIEEALQDDDLAYRIEFDDTVLVWAGWSRALKIQATGLRVADAGGATLATVPAASLGLSGAALLRGLIAPSSIELIGLRLGLVRDKDGQVQLAGGHGGSGSTDDGAADALVADLLNPPRDDHPLAGLKRVSLREATLVLQDEAAGLTWTAPSADLTLDLDDAAIVGHLSTDLQVRDIETRIEAQLFHHRESKMGSAAVTFSELTPARLAFLSPILDEIAGVRVPLSGTVAFDVAPGGIFSGADFDIAGGAGEVAMPPLFPAPVSVRRLAAAGTIDSTLSRLVLDSFALDTDRPSFLLEGEIWQDHAGIGVRGRFQARDMPFDSLDDYWPETIIGNGRRWIVQNVDDGVITRFDATLDIEPGTLEHERFDAASAVGTFAFKDARIHYLRPMPAVAGVEGFARFSGDSLDLTMSGGRIAGLTASYGTASLSDIHEDEPLISVTVEAEGPAADAFALLDHPRLPLMSKVGLLPAKVAGTVHTLFTVDLPLLLSVTAEKIDLDAVARVRDARAEEIAGVVDMSEGLLRLGIDKTSMDLHGTARLQGMPATIFWRQYFDDSGPFARYFDVSMAVTPEGQAALGYDLAPYVQGSIALDANITDPGGGEPLLATLHFDAAEARLDVPDLQWSKPAGEPGMLRVDAVLPPEGAIELSRIEAETETMHAAGRATLARGFAHFTGDAPFLRGLDASATMTPKGEAALELDLAPYVRGSPALDARFADPGGGKPPSATLVFDMTDAQLEIPELDWSKPAGEPGTVHILAVLPRDGPVEFARVEVETKTLYALGKATLSRGSGTARDIVIERLRHGETDIEGRIETGGGATRVSVRGAGLDARPYLSRLMEEGVPHSGQLTLDLDVESVVTAENRQLADVQARFTTNSEGRHTGFLVGTLTSGTDLHFSLEQREGKRLVTVRSADAGAAARTFNIYDNAVGGDLLMEAVLHDDRPGRPVTGTVRIDDYTVTDAPTLARLLTIATLTGIVDALRGDGISFSKFILPFSIEDGIVTIRDARTSGFSIGVNAEGTVDLETDEVDIRGTIVPAYSLNSLVGIIPVLGDLLSSGEGGGLFAATYRVGGTTAEPAVSVNPLSILAPSFLRNLFWFLEEDDADPVE